MPTVTNKGGHISQYLNAANHAQVDEAKATQTIDNSADWVVTLKGVPTQANFGVGQALTYNSKGTRNPNADNNLTVTSVVGPTKYKCTGNWPMNI